MRCPMRSLTLLLIGAALAASTALGQSLVVKKGDTNYWINVSAPSVTPYVLQESANLHLWADIHDGVQGQYSEPLDGAGVMPRFTLDLQRYYRLTPSPPPAPPIVVS